MQPSRKRVDRPEEPTDALNTISEQLAEQLEWLAKISRQLEDVSALMREISENTAATASTVPARSPVARLPDRWARVGDALWRAAYRVDRAMPVAHGARARALAMFYAAYGRLFPHSLRLEAHRRYVDRQRRGLPIIGDTTSASTPPVGPRPYDVFIFPVIDWSFRHQRPQHLAEQLGRRGHRVFYLTTTFEPSHAYQVKPRRVAENVYVVGLPCSGRQPRIYEDRLTAHQTHVVVAGLESICERLETSASIAIVHHPFWWPVASQLSNTGVVYDCIDHHSGFSNASTRVLELEASLIAGADLVVATSERLWARHAASARRSVVIRNGTDFDHFAAVAGAADGRGPRPVVGYYGAIAEWFDAELVASVAAALPDCDFVLIGATAGADVSALRTAKNVRLIGEIPYRDLPAYAASFDVCMIPFRINDLTLNTNPVKVYEYLSMGKPVVSVRLPELALLSAHVRIADTADDFCRHIRESLAENSTAAIEHRREFARQHTWAARVDQFEAEVAPLFPLMSVIVLTHNGLEFTKACLTSLDQFSSYPHWELILVDNASSDGTAAYLEDFVRSRPYARVVSHAENLGFAAGNNAGARAARGEYLVFLNNDTYVTRGWLGDLRRHFEVRPELGILNPVTNNIGNEARIDIVYRDMTEMAREAASFTTARRGRTIALDVCAFFCVMIPRRVWDDVGELDEQFGLGFFEDDDYAQRLKRKGYALACAEDVFVHHHLSASFDALGAEHKRRQFERNRALFEAKWGSWDPHRYRQPSPAIAAGRTGGAEHR